jgi:hypothetical protein
VGYYADSIAVFVILALIHINTVVHCQREVLMRSLYSIVLSLLFLLPTSSFAGLQDSDFIDMIKKSNAAILEKGLPAIAIPVWLENTFQYGGKATWEVNDCGEGGDGRSAPVCVEMIIPQQNGYNLHISTVVGDTAGQKVVKPQIMMVYFHKADGYKTLDVIRVKTIAEAIQLYKTNLGAKSK